MGSPKVKTIKRLFALSGNQCAFPGCLSPIIAISSGEIIGEVCHIKAQRPNAPRYDPSQNDSERHAFENLILLCPLHHTLVDSDADSYTVEHLIQIKNEHEKRNLINQDISDNLVNKLVNSNNFSQEIEYKKQIQRESHDLEIFQSSNVMLNETQLRDALAILFSEHIYNFGFRTAIASFHDFFCESQNQYIDSTLKQASIQLVEALEQLIDFLDINFFMLSTSQGSDIWYCLHPHLCMDRNFSVSEKEALQYDEYVAQLNNIGNSLKRAYETYRWSVKEALIV